MAVGLRARAPLLVRALALAMIAGSIGFVIVSYLRQPRVEPFIMRPGAPELSSTVVGVVEGYERRVMEGDRLRLVLRAARDITFEDGHHELEEVYLAVYPAEGDQPDQVSAHRAIYDQENGIVSFAGNIQIETRDHLRIRTEAAFYNQRTEVAEADVPLTFERENVRGRSDAATLDMKNKHLQLRGGVEITVEPGANGNATGETARAVANPRSRPVTIRAPLATFDHNTMHLAFSGGATAEQEQDIMSGERLSATLNAQRRVQKVDARGNSYLRSMSAGRAAEVRSADMDFYFDGDQRLEAAVATRDVRARSLDADSEAQIATPNQLRVGFVAQGQQSLLREMTADGRPVITLAAPRSRAGDPRAANKRLTADTVRLFWRVAGRDLERAEAVGNAELIVEPVQQSAEADRKTLVAPRFDCDFYETGNLARNFVATGGARAVIAPVQADTPRGERTLTSQQMTTIFTRETQDAERVEAAGDAKFNEGDRNGQAANAIYTASDATVRLRGGEPVVWDSRARIKADELDSDTRNRVSYGRGRATTTYYSQEQTGGATPFQNVRSPVFIVSHSVEFQHETGVAIYTGDARAWQDDNFVRGNRITLRRETKRMEADGSVQSALYNARRRETSGARTVVPVFATADRMFYSDEDRLLHYEGNVDIKQGQERITGEVADVFLRRDASEVERTVAQRNVVITQPGKRGTGERAEYTAADETVLLTGSPARVEDAEQGTTESRRMTIFLRENRVVAEAAPAGQPSAGRVRSSHRVRRP